MMDELLAAIGAAVATDATVEQKTIGAQACRTILTALEAEAGKPFALPGLPAPSPLSGLVPEQALDLLIARLRAALPNETTEHGAPVPVPARAGLRIALVTPPPAAANHPIRAKR